jgi:hypothetical protein
MGSLVAKLFDGDPIPVAVVADQQDIAQAEHAEENSLCEKCGEMPCKCMGRREHGLMPDY